jgi:dipeptidyl aminopeptidase/acylaminoacyl peptidase
MKTELIPRATLFGNPERAGVQISPDGRHLSWLAAVEGVLNVWVAPVAELERARPVTADRKRPVHQYFWAFDGQHLLYLQDDAGDENFHLYRVNVATSEVRDLTPMPGARAIPYKASPRHPGTLLVGLNARDPEVFDPYAIDLASGERRLLLENHERFVDYHFDHELTLRLATRMEADGSSVIFAYDPASKSWQEHDRVGGDDLMTTAILGFDKSGSRYHALDSRERDTGALYVIDARTRDKTLLFEDPRVDIAQALFHPTEHTLQAVSVDYDLPRWVVIAPELERDFAALQALAGGAPHIGSRTLDDQVWIVAFESDRASTRYYRWDRAAQQGTFLFSALPALDSVPLVRMHPVSIEARDGLELMSYLSLPLAADPRGSGRPERPVPTVLLVHGGPWARDSWGLDPLHQLLANRGYAVLAVNFRGSTGFGKAFINAGDRQWGKRMHDDLLDATAWLVAQGIAPSDGVAIMGGSYGGYATLAALTLSPDVYACGVDIVGPSSIVTLMETIPPYWAPMIALFHRRVGDPSTPEGKRELLDVSPLTHAARITRPLLIGQGANDPRVKKSESDQIVRELEAKGIPVGYVLFPDEGHGFARPENNIAFYAVMEAFLAVHLRGRFEPMSAEELAASSLQLESGRDWLPGLPAV